MRTATLFCFIKTNVSQTGKIELNRGNKRYKNRETKSYAMKNET